LGITGSDLVNAVSVVAGDVISLREVPTGLVFSLRSAAWGVVFEADTDGESLLFGNAEGISDTDTEFQAMHSGRLPDATWTNIEDFLSTGQECTLRDFHVLLQTAPGAGKSFTFTSRVNSSAGGMSITIGEAATAGSDLVNSDAISDDDEVGVRSVPSGTPTTSDVAWGCVCFLAGSVPPSVDLAVKLCLGQTYTAFFGTDTIDDLCFEMPVAAWTEVIRPKAFVLPVAGIQGVALSLNQIEFMIQLRGTLYGNHEAHPVISGTAHRPDKQDLEEAAILFNKDGLENRAKLELDLPAGTRTYFGAVKDVELKQISVEGGYKWEYTLNFQVIWTSSKPEWRGWT